MPINKNYAIFTLLSVITLFSYNAMAAHSWGEQLLEAAKQGDPSIDMLLNNVGMDICGFTGRALQIAAEENHVKTFMIIASKIQFTPQLAAQMHHFGNAFIKSAKKGNLKIAQIIWGRLKEVPDSLSERTINEAFNEAVKNGQSEMFHWFLTIAKWSEEYKAAAFLHAFYFGHYPIALELSQNDDIKAIALKLAKKNDQMKIANFRASKEYPSEEQLKNWLQTERP